MIFSRYFIFFYMVIFSASSVFAKPIKIGVIAGPSVQVLDLVKKIAKSKYDLDIQPVIFVDYIMPNEAVNSGDIDMNIFQTRSYLNQSIAKRNYKITSIGDTFIFPMGIYSRKISSLAQLKEKSIVAIPNDFSNEGRALSLLNQAGLIKLKSDSGEFPSLKDIVENDKKLKIVTLDAGQLARIVPDVDLVVLNNDFVNNAGFKSEEALHQENPETAKSYVNVIVVKVLQKEYEHIVSIMNSKEVYEKTLQLYPGAIKAR